MYDFVQLSPADLEELARDLLQRHWGVRLESFKSGRDHGIDLRYSKAQDQNIIIQCKHFAVSGTSKLLHELRASEANKVAHLKPTRYLIVTSVKLNPNDKEQIRKIFYPYLLSYDDILGAEDLNNLLRMYPEIEGRHYKLWLSSTAVLQRILHNAEQVQTDFDVARVQKAIPLYVQNQSYSQAMKILQDHRFVIISGVPGIGKTTLADLLLYEHLESGYQPVVIKSDITEGRKKYQKDLRQIFYFDDFLGETFLGSRFDFLGKKEDSALLDFMELISTSKSARLILTTREHILQHAFQISERFDRGKDKLSAHKCVLELSAYKLIDRGKILYNHIYFSDLPDPYKSELLKDQFYLKILKHRNFNPRLIEWLSRFTNIQFFPLQNYQAEVEKILDNPSKLWRNAFEQQISESGRSLLLTLYSFGGRAPLDRLELAWKALHRHRSAKYNFKTSAEEWRRSLQELEGGFVKFEEVNPWFQQEKKVSFVNPSVKDFLDGMLVSEPEHLDDLLASGHYFTQIVHIWDLLDSEKGKCSLLRSGDSSTRLVQAIKGIMLRSDPTDGRPADQKDEPIEHDVSPEERLKTLISIALRTLSAESVAAMEEYTAKVICYWRNGWTDFSESMAVLRLLLKQTNIKPEFVDIRKKIKRALAEKLDSDLGSRDLAYLVEYVTEEENSWGLEIKENLKKCFENYLKNHFSEELSDFSDESDLETLSSTLENIGSWCNRDVSSFQWDIKEQIEKIAEPDRNDEEGPSRSWDNDRGGALSERAQEIEVTNLFDGLMP